MVIAADGKQQIVLSEIAELLPTSASHGVSSSESDQCPLFDFAKGPLYQFNLRMVGPNEHLFTVNTHYLISDGWSLELLFRELWATYHLLSNRHDPKLQPAVPFREYLSKTEAAIGNSSMQEHESFWLSRFNTLTEIPSLPTDFTLGDRVTWAGVRHSNRIPDHVRNSLRQMCAEQKVTEFTVLFAAFELVVNEQFGTNQVVVGVPTSGRDFDGSELVVGHCVNVIPVMIERPKYQTATDHIQCMDARLKETLAHRTYPFARLLSPELDTQLATQRLFNMTFNKDKTVQNSNCSSLLLSIEKRPLTFCRYDLTFNLSELGATGMMLDIEYKSALFAYETIKKLAAKYLRHLETLTSGNFLKG